MKNTELAGIARALLAAIGGILVTRGFIDAETLNTVIGALVTLGVAAWSVWSKRSEAAKKPAIGEPTGA